MEQLKMTLVAFFGLNEDHADKIIELPEEQRSRKIEELRDWRQITKMEF
ncbi:hypothetical protein VMHJH2_10230 [Streptococcus uberis]|nr:hypothetical protein [Streptococcus uberis]MCR4258890.1 hypothetical protein [Streptococcus uberis]